MLLGLTSSVSTTPGLPRRMKPEQAAMAAQLVIMMALSARSDMLLRRLRPHRHLEGQTGKGEGERARSDPLEVDPGALCEDSGGLVYYHDNPIY